MLQIFFTNSKYQATLAVEVHSYFLTVQKELTEFGRSDVAIFWSEVTFTKRSSSSDGWKREASIWQFWLDTVRLLTLVKWWLSRNPLKI